MTSCMTDQWLGTAPNIVPTFNKNNICHIINGRSTHVSSIPAKGIAHVAGQTETSA